MSEDVRVLLEGDRLEVWSVVGVRVYPDDRCARRLRDMLSQMGLNEANVAGIRCSISRRGRVQGRLAAGRSLAVMRPLHTAFVDFYTRSRIGQLFMLDGSVVEVSGMIWGDLSKLVSQRGCYRLRVGGRIVDPVEQLFLHRLDQIDHMDFDRVAAGVSGALSCSVVSS